MKVVNSKEFNELRNQGNVVVDFFAQWCGPCKMLSPLMEEISKDYPDVTFVKVDVDENEDLAVEFKIMSIPNVYFLKNGEVVNSFLGCLQEGQIRELLDKAYK